MQNLSVEELYQIYNGFIVPQPRRERRDRQRHVTEVSTKLECEGQIPTEMDQIVQRIKVVHVVGEKRSSSDFYEQEVKNFCSTPKRSRIDYTSSKLGSKLLQIGTLTDNQMVQ